MRRKLSYVIVRPALLILASIFCSTASAEALPGVLTQIGHGPPFAVRPAQIIYTGDGSGILGGFTGKGPLRHFGRLHWASWTGSQARGSGAVWLDDCTPNCAQGTFHSSPVQIRAFAEQSGHFTRLTLRYTHNGKHVHDQLDVAKFGGDYGYYIIGNDK